MQLLRTNMPTQGPISFYGDRRGRSGQLEESEENTEVQQE